MSSTSALAYLEVSDSEVGIRKSLSRVKGVLDESGLWDVMRASIGGCEGSQPEGLHLPYNSAHLLALVIVIAKHRWGRVV